MRGQWNVGERRRPGWGGGGRNGGGSQHGGGRSACITMRVHICMSGYDSSTFWIFLGQCHLKHLILPHKGN